jgi:hypothetical protein
MSRWSWPSHCSSRCWPGRRGVEQRQRQSGRGSLFDESVVDAAVALVEDGSFTL